MAEPAALFLQDLTDLLNRCQRQHQDGGFSHDEFEFCRRKLEYYLSVLEYIGESLQSRNIQVLAEEVRPWLQWLESQPISRSHCCTNPASIQPNSGDQGFKLTSETLEFLRDSGFKWTDISKMFGVSRSTITRRVREYGLQSSQTFSDISDTDLAEVISEIHSSHVDAGCRIVSGILRARGIRVTMRRVHETLSAVDPVLSAQRWGAVVQRRQYSVKAANSLWHVDSHHSLIRWRCIVHGGIHDIFTLKHTVYRLSNPTKYRTARGNCQHPGK